MLGTLAWVPYCKEMQTTACTELSSLYKWASVLLFFPGHTDWVINRRGSRHFNYGRSENLVMYLNLFYFWKHIFISCIVLLKYWLYELCRRLWTAKGGSPTVLHLVNSINVCYICIVYVSHSDWKISACKTVKSIYLLHLIRFRKIYLRVIHIHAVAC